MRISEILETKEIVDYLSERGLVEQYKKVKQYLLLGLFSSVTLKKRQPKSSGVWYFRINKQFRAYAYIRGGVMKVFYIDNHQ